ncbi:MAG TPA: glycyl-radical enzyme activating protein [Myxococcota bacterium]|nr:glycyl-radical enzyme activating protein [Myxococcota bacterium]
MGASVTGLVFDVQRFSVHDGPGIRTTVFFKGCPLRCAWCQNPESLRPRPEIAVDERLCRGAVECASSCPSQALEGGGRDLDRSRCDGCGDCVRACPHGALRLMGRVVTVAELLEEVARDRPFYESSGGGITLSGGEPTAQPEFVSAFVEACHGSGLEVGLQTCGAFSWDALAPTLDRFAFIHFDLKVIDDGAHRRLTSASNRVILDNARRLAAAEVSLHFRSPMVPGLTDTPENLDALAGFLAEVGARHIHLLAYHDMGETKLPRLAFPIPPCPLVPRRTSSRRRLGCAGGESR